MKQFSEQQINDLLNKKTPATPQLDAQATPQFFEQKKRDILAATCRGKQRSTSLWISIAASVVVLISVAGALLLHTDASTQSIDILYSENVGSTNIDDLQELAEYDIFLENF